MYPEQNFPTGVIVDTRSSYEKEKDFLSSELFAAPPKLDWRDYQEWIKDLGNIKMLATIEIQNQDGSFSCLAQAGALALAINNWVEEGKYRRMSARPIYLKRRNKPDKGMWVDDLGNIATKKGALFESMIPSEGYSEEKMNNDGDMMLSLESIEKIYRAKNYIWLPVNSIDEIAGVQSQFKPVVIALVFGNGEWAQETPTITASDAPYGHGIVALPMAYFMWGGQKAVMIQDSWGIDTGNKGRRILTEEWFLKGRVKAAFWFEDLKNLAVNNDVMDKPSYKFLRQLKSGDKGYDVAMLQRCLGYLKDDGGYLFPLTIEPTGYFGGITRSAIKRFQALSELNPTGEVDNRTLDKLNIVFS